MEDWHQIIKSIAITAENVTTVGRLLVERMLSSQDDPEISAYKRRVRNRKQAGEFRPEWDPLGFVAFDEQGVQFRTEMDRVPQHLQDLMTYSIRTGRIKPGPDHTIQTSDEEYLYMLEVAVGWPSNASQVFAFWRRPA